MAASPKKLQQFALCRVFNLYSCSILCYLRGQIGRKKDCLLWVLSFLTQTDWPRGFDAKKKKQKAWRHMRATVAQYWFLITDLTLRRSCQCEELSILVAPLCPKQRTAMSQRCCVEPNMCRESHKQALPACFPSSYTTITSSYLIDKIFGQFGLLSIGEKNTP